MKKGIYKLSFKGTDSVYIGQSIDIDRRYKSHIYNLSIHNSSMKMLEAYHKYGEPLIEILLEAKDNLDNHEKYFISLYDSVQKGFNTYQFSGSITKLNGELNGKSKYTNNKIAQAFILLYDGVDYSTISYELDININTLRSIKNGINHKWLKDVFPLEYDKMILNRVKGQSAESLGIEYPKVISPEGIEYEVKSLNKFAKEHNLNAGSLSLLLNNKQKKHKMWVRKN